MVAEAPDQNEARGMDYRDLPEIRRILAALDFPEPDPAREPNPDPGFHPDRRSGHSTPTGARSPTTDPDQS